MFDTCRTVRHGRFHADEPLLGRPKDDRPVAAPAVRVGVVDVGLAQQRPVLAQVLDDVGVGLENGFAFPGRDSVSQTSRVVDIALGAQAVASARDKIIGPVRGGGVDGTGALLGRDIVGQHAQDRPVQKRVLKRGTFQHRSGKARQLRDLAQLAGLAHAREQGGGNDVHLTGHGFRRNILKLGVKRDGNGGRQGPRRGCPDDDRCLAPGERFCKPSRKCRGVAGQPVAHIHAGRGVHLVLDLGVGQRGAVMEAPVHRLEPLVDEATLKKAVKGLKRRGLVAGRHGEVGPVPCAEDAQPLELAALEIDILLRVAATGRQELFCRHLVLFAAQLLVHLDLDRQAMAVPARHVRRIETGHGF